MTERRQRAWLIVALIVSDALAVAGALALALYLRLSGVIVPYTSPYELVTYVRTILLAIPVWLLIFAAHRLYHFDLLLGGPDEYASVVKGCTFGVVVLVVLSYFERRSPLSRGWLLVSWVTTALIVGTMRFLIRRVVFRLRRRGRFVSRAVIVGTNEQAKAIARQLHPPVSSGIEVVGFVDDFLPVGTQVLHDLRVLASPRLLPSLTKEKQISEIVVVPQAMAWESFQEVLLANGQTYNGAQVRISPGFYELLTTGVRVDHKSFVPLLTPERARITGVDALLKVLFDYALVLGGAVLWLPVLAILIVLKKVVASGPVFRRQLAIGRYGKPFTALTLGVDSAASAHEGNPFRFGQRLDRFLLRTGLYRIPQFLHVLCGQMSLVGPRPVPASYADANHRWLPNLLTVKPGVTGPWVMAGTAQERPEEEIRLDTYYVRNWTIWLDFQILFRTISVVLTGGRRPDDHA
jgi:lipopolysaccharide/colanic/teichoic acid biosynthesis glycosyltransferase